MIRLSELHNILRLLDLSGIKDRRIERHKD